MASKKKKPRKKNVRHRVRVKLFDGPIAKMSDEALAHATHDSLVRWSDEMHNGNANAPATTFLAGIMTAHVQEMIARFRPRRGPPPGTPNTGKTKRGRAGRFAK